MFLEVWRGLRRVHGENGIEGGAELKYPLLHSTDEMSVNCEPA